MKQTAQALTETTQKWGSLDVLHNNVGVSIARRRCRSAPDVTEENFDNVCHAINLRGTVFACKHAVAIMRKQGGRSHRQRFFCCGRRLHCPYVAYKAAKAGVVAFTEQLALQNAQSRHPCQLHIAGPDCDAHGCRTPAYANGTSPVSGSRPSRRAKVPLGRQGLAGWDVANAALFLAPPMRPNFITGISSAGRWWPHLEICI
ncbi:SDR family oxidoreductase [Cupriavidus basilensis]